MVLLGVTGNFPRKMENCFLHSLCYSLAGITGPGNDGFLACGFIESRSAFVVVTNISRDCPLFLALMGVPKSHWFLAMAFLSKWLINALKKASCFSLFFIKFLTISA